MENAIEYIVNRNPNGARRVTTKYGMEPVTNEGLVGSVYQMIDQYGDPAIADMFSEHPDGEAINANFNGGNRRKIYSNIERATATRTPVRTPARQLPAVPTVPENGGQPPDSPRNGGVIIDPRAGVGGLPPTRPESGEVGVPVPGYDLVPAPNGNGGTDPAPNGVPAPNGGGYGGGGGGGTQVEDDLATFQEQMNILSCEQLKTELAQLEEYAQVTRMTEEEAAILDQERNIIQTLIAEKCAVNGDGRSRTAKVLIWAAIIGLTLWAGSKMSGSK